jgi:hypothetical protein
MEDGRWNNFRMIFRWSEPDKRFLQRSIDSPPSLNRFRNENCSLAGVAFDVLPGYRGFRTTACLKTDPDLQTRISIEMGE